MDLLPLNKMINSKINVVTKKIDIETLYILRKNYEFVCTQRNKYAQNNPLAIFKIVLRSPLVVLRSPVEPMEVNLWLKIIIENIYFNN